MHKAHVSTVVSPFMYIICKLPFGNHAFKCRGMLNAGSKMSMGPPQPTALKLKPEASDKGLYIDLNLIQSGQSDP